MISTAILERGILLSMCERNGCRSKSSLLYKIGFNFKLWRLVGRSMDVEPTGDLIFFHDGLNRSIKNTIKEIKLMNKEAGL